MRRISWEISYGTLLAFWLTATVAGWAQTATSSESYAAGLAGEFQLDGAPDEPFWNAVPALELIQQAPLAGQPTPYATRVRVAATSENLYIAFECIDPEPGQITVHTMQRDGAVETDDFVSVILDTYGDRRTGYSFSHQRGSRA